MSSTLPPTDLTTKVEEVIRLLVKGEYSRLAEATRGVRLDSAQIEGAISQYGRKLVMPPQAGYQYMDAIEVRGAVPKRWSVVMPLWTDEEGRSDLSVELTISQLQGKLEVELDDIRVR